MLLGQTRKTLDLLIFLVFYLSLHLPFQPPPLPVYDRHFLLCVALGDDRIDDDEPWRMIKR